MDMSKYELGSIWSFSLYLLSFSHFTRVFLGIGMYRNDYTPIPPVLSVIAWYGINLG